MPNQVNYQKELDKLIAELNGRKPTLLLHSCCAPCSSYVLEYLRQFFVITVFYYNPNISFEEEYRKRVEEQKRLIDTFNKEVSVLDFAPIQIIEGDYEPQLFYEMAKGREDLPEGGERCFDCYRLRLNATADLAKQKGFDYFGTTLTISPLKNAAKLNEIGISLQEDMANRNSVGQAVMQSPRWLPSDFKKKNGYKRSIELSAEYDLYRQDYCGCVYSKRDRDTQKHCEN
ncbi:MAG: epoxyqueuosine reductase QueH [Lachnospiraceae bacterium]|nr:epoxyqueuosine reductase QueH [Lachnospiraceae bacterium]